MVMQCWLCSAAPLGGWPTPRPTGARWARRLGGSGVCAGGGPRGERCLDHGRQHVGVLAWHLFYIVLIQRVTRGPWPCSLIRPMEAHKVPVKSSQNAPLYSLLVTLLFSAKFKTYNISRICSSRHQKSCSWLVLSRLFCVPVVSTFITNSCRFFFCFM